MPSSPILLAYYLPQFHPTPENDEWWGKGFTEWTNVTKAKPLFKGHNQPNFPADLGYYDLRIPEVREAQAAMAKEYGLGGFCYYHYWFGNGKQVLNGPIDDVIASGAPDFPFCLCWANQSWTGHWFGAEKEMLIEQEYLGDADIEYHFQYLLRAFNDKRYIRIDDKPLFKILDIRSLPDPAHYATKLKQLAVQNGLKGLYLVAGNFVDAGWDPVRNNFDAVTDDGFARTLRAAVNAKNSFISRLWFNRYTRRFLTPGSYFKRRNTFTMQEFMKHYKVVKTGNVVFPLVLPNWDNTPRSLENGFVIRDDSPAYFREQLEIAKEHIVSTGIPPVIFIKSWNEWAEGNYLEPDSIRGFSYLKTIKEFLDQEETKSSEG